jgi:Mn2+/Fe2+ NRAMP family transporter
MTSPEQVGQRPSVFRSMGPAIIVASVVLGPGSILTNSKVGWQFGYDMVWVLACTAVLMIGMTALSARLGVSLDGTLCDELARRAGRPVALLAGVTLFLVVACFQFGNNLGILYSLEPLLDDSALGTGSGWAVATLVGLNVAIIVVLFGFRQLYTPVERLMKTLVTLMVVGFAANLLLARPSLLAVFSGLIPQLPEGAWHSLLPRLETVGGQVVIRDDLLAVQGLIGTTFSVGGAFYQAYLVRQKGWTRDHLRQGLFDSFAGISVLALMSVMVMVTAASVLHGNPDVQQLNTAADVARQLQPLFGPLATALFCMGIFAGAFSSFLVNAMIGGTVLSDGLGRGGSMDQIGPKICTVLALLAGMVVAIAVKALDFKTGDLIIFAQALTVLGNPLLAGAMLWLATRADMIGERGVPMWIKVVSGLGFILVVALSLRTAVQIYLKLAAT